MFANRRLTIRPIIAAAALGTTAIAGIAGGAIAADQGRDGIIERFTAPGPAAVASTGIHASLSDMVEAVGPSVVQIQVKPQMMSQQQGMPMQFGSDDGDLSDRLGQLFGFAMPDGGERPSRPDPRQGPQRGALGSGFIVDASGLVITNNHVVEGADRVTVQMSDGRELPGRVLGRDPKIDVAVVRIEGKGIFIPIKWGDSDHIRVGDSVFAVGSPFGLGNTVTSGIVSARGREIGAGPYDDFLQVDAAINSGNSGGPLFDGSGRVVGVNTAIFSPSGGNVGIGFAIPAKMARQVALQIAQTGHVSRGRIGVALQDVTPEIAGAMGLNVARGALIAEVEDEGAAARSGMQRGDVVRRFGSRPIDNGRDLARAVAEARIGSSVATQVIRDGRPVSLDLRIAGEASARS
ncbi:trypsin-like peptidase domain-containing protein [Sphingomonas mollis]|uniref:Trypsin-like peptidase domain-containing protein n=1 Tax=Sphingomonas mollis TaxID=2795726 RepID=A0ABS0XJE1_9SPHN|nr:trypsin-like peptidase domain-containing protein [Sphingomonas sp. BT553]MBJ6120171.1 trypsin-like peptidase domain-containing protein [Sphingomonas sp. BT553]